ncbi:MAG: sulfide/dihydroorotate dehydrogenase-like FAD/NAD-binding protein [Gammaproteobacteria bacterium]|nr:sulfide/dihydroorotate dehydrogenase-like FAD/NAD-binding protein [Gammaproteobacteria bacterium]
MNDTKYLYQRNRVWYVKVAVPRTLRAALGYDLRRSLQTESLEAAKTARDAVVAEFRQQIRDARAALKQTRACKEPAVPDDRNGFLIVAREDYSDVTFMLEVKAPLLARAAEPGQFVIVILHERGERIPLTIADFNRDKGTVTLVIQAVGKSTFEMQQRCRKGTHLHALVGPMGYPSELGARKVVCVGGGLGVAPIFPQLRAFKESGAYVIGVVGFRSKDLIFWQDRFEQYCDELLICTDDGSAGIAGRVTVGLEAALAKHDDIDHVIAIGPPIMMKACAETTRGHDIKTIVSMNPIVVDGTGMCGGCRVTVGNEIRFACVDGPEFDAHKVDFDELIKRLGRYRRDEQVALETWKKAAS